MEYKCTLREWQQLEKPVSYIIVQASDKYGHDSWKEFPIGMSHRYIDVYKKGKAIQVGNHEHLVFSSFSENTDQRRRGNARINRRKISDILKQRGIQNMIIDHHTYFDMLPSHKFTISPEGNGIDCHRHYEALIAGCIPIIEKHPLTCKKYKNCPVLFTNDYSEITEEYLNRKYNQMIDKVYDFRCLFLSFYPNNIQRMIKENSNKWMYQFNNVQWYV